MNREQAQKAIQGAAICGILSTGITLIATLVAVKAGKYQLTGMDISAFNFVDVVLMAGLTVGLFLRSRVCAVLMFVYFVLCKYLQWSTQIQGGHINSTSLVVGALFLFLYFRGILGTFAYQKLKKEEAAQAAVPPPMP